MGVFLTSLVNNRLIPSMHRLKPGTQQVRPKAIGGGIVGRFLEL